MKTWIFTWLKRFYQYYLQGWKSYREKSKDFKHKVINLHEIFLYFSLADINPEIRERFNPCIFLAQFLMRNNPKYQNNAEKQQIEDFVRKEKCMRYFKEKREEFLKLFKKSLRTDKTHCPYSDLKLFAQTLDFMYELKGDLREYLVPL